MTEHSLHATKSSKILRSFVFFPPFSSKDSFCTLKHLVELDLSKNSLRELPEGFGELSQLQRLDLLRNKLTTLPLSFWKLKRLRWLDLNGNNLEPGLAEAAGMCLNEQECKNCAKQVRLMVAACSEANSCTIVTWCEIVTILCM